MHRFLPFVAAVAVLVGCAKPEDPRGDISRAVVILLCTTEPGTTDSRVAEVLKNSAAGAVRVVKGDVLTWPLIDKEFTRAHPMRLVFFEDSNPKFLAQFSGPRWEAPVVDGRIALYGISLEEFRTMVGQTPQMPNKAPEPTPGSVTSRATSPKSE